MGISPCSSSVEQDVPKSQKIVLDRLTSPTTDYLLECIVGEGTYGQVVKCVKTATKEMVAVKIFKSTEFTSAAQNEVDTLRRLMSFDSDRFNFVGCDNIFIDRQHLCIEFEILDQSLSDFLDKRPSYSLSVKEIRPILYQMATTLQLLRSLDLVHMDLKPDNIMMVDAKKQPFRIKLIDFGFAQHISNIRSGLSVPLCNYRSPEVILGLPLTPAIDMWSLGCVAAELFLGHALDPQRYENHLGLYDYGHSEHLDILNKQVKPVFHLSAEDTIAEIKDQENFVHLIKMMLNLDWSKRITPSQVLQHPFITMSSLAGCYPNSFYLKVCFELMEICRDQSQSGDNRDVKNQTVQSQLTDLDVPAIPELNLCVDPAWPKHREHPLVLNTLLDMSKLSICENQSPPLRRRGKTWRENTGYERKRKRECCEALHGEDRCQASFLIGVKRKKMDLNFVRTKEGLYHISEKFTAEESKAKLQRKRTREETGSEGMLKKNKVKDAATQTEAVANPEQTSSMIDGADLQRRTYRSREGVSTPSKKRRKNHRGVSFPQCLRNGVLQVPDVLGVAFRAVTGIIHTWPQNALDWFKKVFQQSTSTREGLISPPQLDQTTS